MKKQIVVFLGLILMLSSASLAQTTTVTNADLEKFRQKRLQAEREYRENYARLGLPSPEELEQKRIEDEKELIEYSQHLETMRLEREALEADVEKERLRVQNQYLQTQLENLSYGTGVYYSGGYLPFYDGFYNYFPRNRRSGFHKNYNRGYDTRYPWMVIPGFNKRVIRIPQPRFRNFKNYGKPRIRTRGGRGRN